MIRDYIILIENAILYCITSRNVSQMKILPHKVKIYWSIDRKRQDSLSPDYDCGMG